MTFSESFATILVFGAFLLFFYGPWQNICTDIARQIAFEQRDKIFDLAIKGDLHFNSDEYRRIRVSIEQNIRFAHELTLSRLLYLAWANELFGQFSSPKASIFSVIDQIQNVSARVETQKRMRYVHTTMVLMTIAKSLISWVILPFFILLLATTLLTARVLTFCNRAIFIAGEIIQLEAACA